MNNFIHQEKCGSNKMERKKGKEKKENVTNVLK